MNHFFSQVYFIFASLCLSLPGFCGFCVALYHSMLGGGGFQPNGHGTNIFNYLAQLGLSAALNTCINVITTMIVK